MGSVCIDNDLIGELHHPLERAGRADLILSSEDLGVGVLRQARQPRQPGLNI